MIIPIQTLGSIARLDTQGSAAEYSAVSGNMFSSIFQNAIQNVKDTDAEKVQAQYLLATGQLDNPAVANIAATKNELAVNLLIQLRNKALDAYSELTRISI